MKQHYRHPFTTITIVILDFVIAYLLAPGAFILGVLIAFFSFYYFTDGLFAAFYRESHWQQQLILSGIIASGYFLAWNPPRFMMQVGGQDGFFVNQSIRFLYYLVWKWFVSLTLPVLLAAYVLIEWATDLRSQALIILALIIFIRRWYDSEILRYRVEELEEQVESHYWDFHHQENDAVPQEED